MGWAMSDELGPLDVAALMEALDRAHHRAARWSAM